MGLICLATFYSFTEGLLHLYTLPYCHWNNISFYTTIQLSVGLSSSSQSSHLSVCLSVLSSCLSGPLYVSESAYLSFLLPHCVLMFLCLVFLPVRAVIRQRAYRSVCLSACLPTCLSLIYLFIYCLICLSGIQCWLEARLPSFTVKCSADWKGHFSNGAALPLIFCLSLGVRLIYHASSPADIQIHFDWRLDGTTPTTNPTNITAALARMHKHTQSNGMFCILTVRYTLDMNMPITPTHTHLHLDMKTCPCMYIYTHS